MTFEDDVLEQARQLYSGLMCRARQLGQRVPREASYASPMAWLEALLEFRGQEDEATAQDD